MAKSRHVVAHAGAAIEAIHDVAINDVAINNGAGLQGLERYSTQQLYAELLQRFDEDPTRNGLLKTPER
ncbi:MAG TPA: GTP cyclohydrolase I FolE, partial [Acidobacteriaceae bacterium]|nr:GTP cyclohydrolase I FolE [Acidobacteriaceae bacterium]